MNTKTKFMMMVFVMLTASFIIVAESEMSDAVTYSAKTLYDSSTSSYYFDSGTSITINNVDNDPNQPSYIVRESNSFTLTTTTIIHIDEYDTESVVIGTKTITFYVNAPSTYTCYLYYDANGGNSAPSTQSYTGSSTSNHTFTISSSTPSRSNYSFLGWSTSSSASSPSYQPGGSISVTYNGSATLYAVWQYNPPTPTQYTCYLYYSANGGSGAPSTQSYTGTSTSSHTFTISNTTPTWTGHTFLGWSTSSSASSPSYQPGGSISVTYNGSQTLYAVWTTTTYTINISFNSSVASVTYNGSSISPNYSTTVTHGSSVTIVATMNTGYTFTDWLAYEPDTGNSDHLNTASITETITADTDYTLEYTTNTYTVSFLAGTGGTVSSASIPNVPYNSAITISNNTITINGTTVIATATTGYAFDSWTNATGSVTANRTITANFLAGSNTVSVSFNNQSATVTVNGSAISPNQSFPVTTGTSITIVATMNTGYTFTDWLAYEPDTGNSDRIYTETIIETINKDTDYTLEYTTNTYTVSFLAGTGGTVSSASIPNVPYNSAITVSGNTVTINGTTVTASPSTGYTFDSWTNATGPVTGAMTITANFTISSYTVTVSFNSSVASVTYNGSSISPNYSTTVTHGSSVTIVATMNTGYTFTDWLAYEPDTGNSDHLNTASITETITADTDYTLEYTLTPEPGPTYWSNDLYNGSVSIAFKFSGSGGKTHVMDIPLYSATIDDQQRATWSLNGYNLEVEVSHTSTTTVTATLTGGSQPITATKTLGNWYAFILTISPSSGSVVFTPIDRFTDFTSYTTMDSQSVNILSWETDENTTLYEIAHEDEGTGNPVRFSVVDTMTFLDTFGVVLTDPSINVFEYFPQYNSVQLNLYAFAVYGQTMTINNHTWDVTAGTVNITYKEETDGSYVVASPGTEGAQSRIFTLSNIRITWTGTECILTFNDDAWSVSLGTYSTGSETISFTGLWYFTASLYEPYTATKTVVSGGWDSLMNIDSSALLLVFLGIILITGLACHIKLGLKWLDISMLVIAMIVAFTLLG